MTHTTALPFVVSALLVTAACSEPRGLIFPSSPTVSIPGALPGAPPSATPITVGQTVRATVTLSDQRCEFTWGPEPCVEFSIVASETGVLWVQLSSAGPSELGLKIAAEGAGYHVNRIERKALVSAGTKYAVRVSFHNAPKGIVDQAFELISGIEH